MKYGLQVVFLMYHAKAACPTFLLICHCTFIALIRPKSAPKSGRFFTFFIPPAYSAEYPFKQRKTAGKKSRWANEALSQLHTFQPFKKNVYYSILR